LRLLLLTGKGGVGTTTVAAATAAHAARCGLKTLLVGLTGSAGLDDVLGGDLPADPSAGEPVELVPGPAVLRLDARDRMTAGWPRLAGPFAAALGGLAADRQAAEELTALPGIPAVADLLAVREQAAADRWDLVVVDGPPADQVVPWVGLPDALARWLDLVLPVEQRVHRAIAIGATAARAGTTGGPAGSDGPPVDGLATGLDRLAAELAQARELLTGPDAAVVLVGNGSGAAVRAAARLRAGLALHGLHVAAAVANRSDRAGAARLAAALPGLRVHRLAEHPAEPVGVQLLAALGAELHDPATGDGLLAAPDLARDALRVVPAGGPDGGFLLELPLPVDDPAAVELSRQGDDLVVRLGPHRRTIRLVPVLRRCTVRQARLADGRLTVTFLPDPALWPVG
jgi:arsenite/tail-anchored protein-transporting ATPase